MFKYKLGLVILLVGFFAVPSQVYPMPLQEIQSPTIRGGQFACIVSNVGSDTTVTATITLIDTNGAVNNEGPFDIQPQKGSVITQAGNPPFLRCTAKWFGHRGELNGSLCADRIVSGSVAEFTCIPLQ